MKYLKFSLLLLFLVILVTFPGLTLGIFWILPVFMFSAMLGAYEEISALTVVGTIMGCLTTIGMAALVSWITYRQLRQFDMKKHAAWIIAIIIVGVTGIAVVLHHRAIVARNTAISSLPPAPSES